jgi:AcrR family transcriptional regulator
MIQTEALRLFAERGYAETTVEEIADAAAISPRTFFRYFPTKEDVVMWDEYDPVALDLLQARPQDEPLAVAFREVIRETLTALYRHDPERLLVRVRLMSAIPDLRARFHDAQASAVEMFTPLLAGKRASGDLQVRVVGLSLIGAVTVALDDWQKEDGKSDLLALLDETFDALAEGMSDLRAAGRSAGGARSGAI